MTDPTAPPVLSALLTMTEDHLVELEHRERPKTDAHDFDYVLEELDAQRAEVARLTQENETLRAAAATVLDGFERGVFCRDTVNDSNPSWAIRLFPYIAALSKLSAALTSPDAEKP